jgi:hypothetical protein
MTINESTIQKQIMLALSKAGCLVFRNNTGAVKDGDRFIRYGLCKGGADIIGLTPDGRFLAVEVKTRTGRPTKEQLTFIERVNMQGGVAGIARTPEDALLLLARK